MENLEKKGRKDELKGNLKKAEGKIQSKLGKAESKLGKLGREVKNTLHPPKNQKTDKFDEYNPNEDAV